MVCKDSKWFVSNKYLGFEAKEKEWEAYVGEVRGKVVSDNKSATLKWRLSDIVPMKLLFKPIMMYLSIICEFCSDPGPVHFKEVSY